MNNKYNINNPMPPLWLRFPQLSRYSIGFRMGYGEDYVYTFSNWFNTLSKEEQKQYKQMFPAPILWGDIYKNEEVKKLQSPKDILNKLKTNEKLDLISFWRTEENPYGCFSQWTQSDFEYEHFTFSSVEQFMMFEKADLFDDDETKELIMQTNNPKEIQTLGRLVKNLNHEIWNKEKYLIAFTANYYKFIQNKEMKDILLSTNDKIIVDADSVDKIWRTGLATNNKLITNANNWKGSNLLGFTLMEVREEIKRVYQNYDKIDWSQFKY